MTTLVPGINDLINKLPQKTSGEIKKQIGKLIKTCRELCDKFGHQHQPQK